MQLIEVYRFKRLALIKIGVTPFSSYLLNIVTHFTQVPRSSNMQYVKDWFVRYNNYSFKT